MEKLYSTGLNPEALSESSDGATRPILDVWLESD